VVVMDPDHAGLPLGFLRYEDILNAYRRELLRRTHESEIHTRRATGTTGQHGLRKRDTNLTIQ